MADLPVWVTILGGSEDTPTAGDLDVDEVRLAPLAGPFEHAVEVPGVHVLLEWGLATPDIVQWLLEGLARHENKAVVGLVGWKLQFPIRSLHQTVLPTDEDYPVHVLDPRCLAYHAPSFRVRAEDFHEPGMADIWLGRLGQRQRTPFVALKHPEDFPGLREPEPYPDLALEVASEVPWQVHALTTVPTRPGHLGIAPEEFTRPRIIKGMLKRATFFVATTYRPNLLSACLRHLAVQRIPEGWAMDILVCGKPDDPGRLMVDPIPFARWVDSPSAGVGMKMNAMMEVAEAELVLLADDDDLQVPGRLEAATAAFESGADWSASGSVLFYDVLTDSMVRWEGPAETGAAGTTVNIRLDLLREVGGYPDVTRGKDGKLYDRLRALDHAVIFHDLSEALGGTVCTQHRTNLWDRPFPGKREVKKAAKFTLTGLGPLDQQRSLDPIFHDTLLRLRQIRTEAGPENRISGRLSLQLHVRGNKVTGTLL